MKSTEKEKRREVQLQIQQRQKQAFIASLPMEAITFTHLFDYLDEKLEAEGCDHSLKFTEEYLQKLNFPTQTIIQWLNENGGFCDCEVLGNIEDHFEGL
jgi:DNA polymerase I-like protein with 3'-5' exonuclease and polymerase domains